MERSPDATTDTPLPRYGLRWAIKTSFVSYVARMPDGRAYLSGGVAVNHRQEIVFPLVRDTNDEDGRTLSFGGEVRFSGHYGMLLVPLAHPAVVLRDQFGEVTVLDPESRDGKRLRLVTFELTATKLDETGEHWIAGDVRLDAAGVALFGDVYQAGEPFEPLSLIVPWPGASHD